MTLEPLAWTRAVHYASIIQLAGIFVFLPFVAEPVFHRTTGTEPLVVGKLRMQLVRLAWISLAAGIASGGLWLVLVAAEMSGESLHHVLSTGLLATVLTGTQFGRDWELRLVLTIVLGCCLALSRSDRRGALGAVGRTGALLCSAADLATLAWAGHAAGTKGLPGDIHRAGDVVHLLAAGAWLGGLVPLALLYSHARRAHDPAWAAIARAATLRFSSLGMTSVAAILVSGIINAWFLVGTIARLIDTKYGQLLLAKIMSSP
jgi:putative copper resistance protein D